MVSFTLAGMLLWSPPALGPAPVSAQEPAPERTTQPVQPRAVSPPAGTVTPTLRALPAGEGVYAVYVPPREKRGASRVGKVEGVRQARYDRTITQDQRLRLTFAPRVDDLNDGFVKPGTGEFDQEILEPDGRQFVMRGSLAGGTLTVKEWVWLQGPGVRARQAVTVRNVSGQISLERVDPDNVRLAVRSFKPSGFTGGEFERDAKARMTRRAGEAATELRAEVTAVFYAPPAGIKMVGAAEGTGFVYLDQWELGVPSPEASLRGNYLAFSQPFAFRHKLRGIPAPEDQFASYPFAAPGGGTIQVTLKSVRRQIDVESPVRFELVRASGGRTAVVRSTPLGPAAHFRYEASREEADGAMWTVVVKYDKDVSQYYQGEFGVEIPYEDHAVPYIVSYVDYLHVDDYREGVSLPVVGSPGGDGEFYFAFVGSTAGQTFTYDIGFPSKYQLDVPDPRVTYARGEIQVPFFAQPRDQMGPTLEVALAGREFDDDTGAKLFTKVHEAAGAFFGGYFGGPEGAKAGRKQGEADAKSWLDALGYKAGDDVVGPHNRTWRQDQDNYGIGYAEDMDFATEGFGSHGDKVHYTVREVDARTLSYLKVTLNSIVVPGQSRHNGGFDAADAYAAFATARAADGFPGGRIDSGRRIPSSSGKYLKEGNHEGGVRKTVNVELLEDPRFHVVPFVYVEIELYDDDDGLGQGMDQLTSGGSKSALYSRLFLSNEIIEEGRWGGTKTIEETRGGITASYTVEWRR